MLDLLTVEDCSEEIFPEGVGVKLLKLLIIPAAHFNTFLQTNKTCFIIKILPSIAFHELKIEKKMLQQI